MAKKVNPFDLESAPPFDGFPKDAVQFLRDLAANNNREWFAVNKDRYESSVRAPMLSLLTTLEARLRAFDSTIVIEPKKAMYRIFRDVRFSADKSPYKTWVAAAFTHSGADRKTDAAYYFHITPDEVGIGGGLYAPSGDQLRKLRAAVDTRHEELRAILAEQRYAKIFGGLTGDELTRVPAGFDKEHPAGDLLRRKQFLAWATVPMKAVYGAGFADTVYEHCVAMAPLMRWLLAHSR